MIFSIIAQIFLLLFFFAKDKNDGEKKLFKRQQWKALDVVIMLLLMEAYPLYFVLVAYIFLQFNIDLRPLIHSLSNRDIVFYVSVISLLLLILIFKFKFKQAFSILGFGKDELRRNIALGMLVGLAAFLTIDGLYLLLLPKQFEERVVEMLTTIRNPYDYFILFFGTVFLGPLVEEVVYRGILYSPFRKKFGPVKAIIITSLFFGVAHPSVPVAFFVAIFLTILYEITESIIATSVAHSAHNLLVVATALLLLK